MVDENVLYIGRISKLIYNLEDEKIDWETILEAFGFEDLLIMHGLFLSSQNFPGDEDYFLNIKNVLKDAYKKKPKDALQMFQYIFKNDLGIQKKELNEIDKDLSNFLNNDLSPSQTNNVNNNSIRTNLNVFISYNTVDKVVAAKIKEILESFGIECFMAHEDIGVSEEWKQRILTELKEADIFIPVLSDNFRKSDWCSQEAGIACFRNILFIPLSLDKKNRIPYGFMSHRQGEIINKYNIPIKYLINPIVDNFPTINIFGNLLDELFMVRGFREAERIMSNLEPFFKKLNINEINRLVDISISNYQIYAAGRCKREYLPKFIKINKDKIDKEKLKKLSELVEIK